MVKIAIIRTRRKRDEHIKQTLIALFSCFYNVDLLINLIFALLSLNIITRLVIGINNTIIKNNVKTTAYNHLSRILASLVYLIPLSQFKSMHNDELKKMNFLRYNFIRLLPNRIKSNIIRDTYFHNIALGFILKNETIIIYFMANIYKSCDSYIVNVVRRHDQL